MLHLCVNTKEIYTIFKNQLINLIIFLVFQQYLHYFINIPTQCYWKMYTLLKL